MTDDRRPYFWLPKDWFLVGITHTNNPFSAASLERQLRNLGACLAAAGSLEARVKEAYWQGFYEGYSAGRPDL